MRDNLIKYLVVALIVFFAVFFDQWTKQWADSSLSSMRYPDHSVQLTVPQSENAQPTTLQEFIKATYPNQPEKVQNQMIATSSMNDKRIFATQALNPGDTIQVNNLSLTVIDGYYDHMYARNPGAAFSFLADKSPDFRKYFFGGTGLLAIILILVFVGFHSWKEHRAAIIFLGCILGGAVGNIIDRFRFGYVIDFISWHVGEHYWPTFNIADVFVTCGVALLIIDLIIHRDKSDPKKAVASEDAAAPEDAAASNETEKSEVEVQNNND